ncbi:MAG: hypothetical protein WC402_03125 [Candidatus Pacearchaeota archaeon]|jgi:hypothetical protein
MKNNQKTNEIMSILSMDVEQTKSTKGYIIDKRVYNDSGIHSLLCNRHFVHFDSYIGGMDKRQKFWREK